MTQIHQNIEDILKTSTNLLYDLRRYLHTIFGTYIDLQDITYMYNTQELLENILVDELTNTIDNDIMSKLIPNFKPIKNNKNYNIFIVDNMELSLTEFISYLEDRYEYICISRKISNIKYQFKTYIY